MIMKPILYDVSIRLVHKVLGFLNLKQFQTTPLNHVQHLQVLKMDYKF